MNITLLTPTQWKDYELIDCGNEEKLERFGEVITIRPEPQAVWDRKLSEKEWLQKANYKFVGLSSSKGKWDCLKKGSPEQWNIKYHPLNLKFRLGLTSFKHVGIFPEQAANWDFIADSIFELKKTIEEPKVLNLFAYTGGASIAAKRAGADVTHLDSIKQVVTWANQNMELSNLENIRWIVDDAMKFCQRAARNGKKFHGIILDPPAFGHGPKGENWKLERDINEMLKHVFSMLEEQHFLVLNTYSLGFSSMILENFIQPLSSQEKEIGELYLQASSGVKLPLGVFARIRNL